MKELEIDTTSGSFASTRVISEGAVRWGYSFSSLSEKTRKSNHLQVSEQRQHFLLRWLNHYFLLFCNVAPWLDYELKWCSQTSRVLIPGLLPKKNSKGPSRPKAKRVEAQHVKC